MNSISYKVPIAIFDACEWIKPRGRKKYSHLVANTSVEDLHLFAKEIGLGRHFFHSSGKHKHYDVPENYIQKVIDHGGVLVNRHELLQVVRGNFTIILFLQY